MDSADLNYQEEEGAKVLKQKRRKALRHPESPAPRHGLATPGAGRRHLGALGSRFPSGGFVLTLWAFLGFGV